MGIDTGIRNMVKEAVEHELRVQLGEALGKLGLGKPDSGKSLKVQEAAEVARVDASTIRRWCHDGLPSVGTGKKRRIRSLDLEAYMTGKSDLVRPAGKDEAPAERARKMAEAIAIASVRGSRTEEG